MVLYGLKEGETPMSKNTWRAERFRSADVRRSVHQRAAKDARKRRRELIAAVNSTARAAEEALEEVVKTSRQRIMDEPSETTEQKASTGKTASLLDKVIDSSIDILLDLALICIVLSILKPTLKALFAGQWIAAITYAITTALCCVLAQFIYKRVSKEE